MIISDVKLNIDESEDSLVSRAREISGIEGKYFRILKKSLDARKKSDIKRVYSVEISDEPFEGEKEEIGEYFYPRPPVVVGFGPAGMFAALTLARAGFKPIIIERGKSVEERAKSVNDFILTRTLDTESNVQYGEGGAGTFSDGKLNSRVKDELKQSVLDEFVRHGAHDSVRYDAKPHIGSDVLPKVVRSIREEIISLGGSVLFDTRLIGIDKRGNKIETITVKNGETIYKIETDDLIIAIGNSARDTYRLLHSAGIEQEVKDFALGYRIEHLQHDINMAQFGKDIGIPADYRLAEQIGERGVFSFCMCPGGTVVAAASEEGGVVTNGMSNFARDGLNANSAIVCQVRKTDMGGNVGAAFDFVERIEKAAYNAGGSDYSAPCQNVADFIKGVKSVKFGAVKPTYPLGVKIGFLDGLLPTYAQDAIRAGIVKMGGKIKGFDRCGVLTGVETRTSSPVRIVRGSDRRSPSAENLFPIGEVGYAGGIMSSAIDGIKTAQEIKRKYLK
jgi:hypothetical protein